MYLLQYVPGVPFQLVPDEEIDRQIALARQYGGPHVRRVFLADGDALVLSTDKLLKILHKLKATFPNLERVASYAAPKDILRKPVEELKQLKEAGLKLLYYGMESGDSVTLAHVNKGVDGPQSIEAGQRVRAAGMQLSMMIILVWPEPRGRSGTPSRRQRLLTPSGLLCWGLSASCSIGAAS